MAERTSWLEHTNAAKRDRARGGGKAEERMGNAVSNLSSEMLEMARKWLRGAARMWVGKLIGVWLLIPVALIKRVLKRRRENSWEWLAFREKQTILAFVFSSLAWTRQGLCSFMFHAQRPKLQDWFKCKKKRCIFLYLKKKNLQKNALSWVSDPP